MAVGDGVKCKWLKSDGTCKLDECGTGDHARRGSCETNRDDLCRAISNAPVPSERAEGMKLFNGGHYLMISVEPKMDCDPGPFAELIREVGPAFVSVGADSKKHNLPEPSAEKVLDLINRLEEFTVVKKKKNLGRLLKARSMGGQTS